MNTSKRRVFISENQKQVMLEFLKKNNKLVSAKFSPEFTVKAAKQLWQEMAQMLNAIPGAIKEWHDWRKTWHDFRCRTRAKSMKITNCSAKADDSLVSEETLNAFEIEVLSLIDESTLLDHQNLTSTNGGVCIKRDLNQTDAIHMLDPLEIFVSEFVEDEIQNNKKVKESHRKKKHTQPTRKLQQPKSLRKYELKMKDKYFKRKLQLLERDVIAKERIAIALETIVNSRRR